MLKKISLLLMLGLALPSIAAAETWNNAPLIDTQCSAKAKADPDAHAKNCALMCAKSGFGIVDNSGNYLKFDAKGNEEALKALQNSSKKDHIRVDATGNKDGNVIHVESLRLL